MFPTLDCNSGYLQVPVVPEEQDKTTFTTHCGTFRYPTTSWGALSYGNGKTTSGTLSDIGRSC